jgi:thiol-disulfide isomerase/thioredoxin
LTIGLVLLAGAPRLVATEPPPAPAPAATAWLGVRLGTANGHARITGVLRGAPADAAGLRPGDEVTAVDGRPVASAEDLIALVRALSVGGSITLSLASTPPRSVVATLASRPGSNQEIFSSVVGSAAPTTEVRGTDGRPHALSRPNTPGVIYFWATWCGACRQSAPRLASLRREVADDRLSIVALSPEGSGEVDRYAAEHPEVPYTLAADEDLASLPDIWVSAYPSFLLVNADGRIDSAYVGSNGVDLIRARLVTLGLLDAPAP